jgi:adenine phosphoribosyltransferase
VSHPRLEDEALAELIARHIRDVPDYPEPGVLFKDITPLLADGPAFGTVIASLAGRYADDIDAVVGIEARGFMFAAPLAVTLGIGFVPVRKAGKRPGDVVDAAYDLEYGSAQIEVHADSFRQGQRVLVLDDVLATGGTAQAACQLVERAGGEVVEFAAVLELGFLAGRDRLRDRSVHSLLLV